jgi:hypothetical protein
MAEAVVAAVAEAARTAAAARNVADMPLSFLGLHTRHQVSRRQGKAGRERIVFTVRNCADFQEWTCSSFREVFCFWRNKHAVFLAKRKLLAERLHIGQGAVEKAG